MEDPSQRGGPALRFAFAGPDDAMVAEDWLAAEEYGAESYFGPTKFELQRVIRRLDVGRFPRTAGKNGSPGRASLHYDGKRRSALT